MSNSTNTTAPTSSPTCQFAYCLSPEDVELGQLVSTIAQYAAIVSIIFFTLGVGAALDIPRFLEAWKRPLHPLIGLLLQTIVNPGIMFALLAIFGTELRSETKVMALLVSSAPGGSSSNLLTYLAYGDLEISIAMTIVSTVGAFATVPLFLFLGQELFLNSLELTIPFENVVLSMLTAALPPLLGVCLQKYTSQRVVQLVKTGGIGSGVVLVCIILVFYIFDPIFNTGLRNAGRGVFIVAVLFNALALGIGYLVPTLARFPESERRAIAYEVGAQNSALPLATLFVTFGTGIATIDFLPFLGVYLISSFFFNYGTAFCVRLCASVPEEVLERMRREEEEAKAEVGTEKGDAAEL